MQYIWKWWWAVVPAGVNIVAQVFSGGGAPVHVVVVGVAYAIVFGLSAPILFHWAWRTHCAVRCTLGCAAGALALFVNFTNALEVTAHISDDRASAPRVQVANREVLHQRSTTITRDVDRLRSTAQYDVPEVIEAYIRKLKTDPIWQRSRLCRDVTQDDSKLHCGQIEGAEMRLAAARRADELAIEQKEIWSKLTTLEGAPEVAEPGLHALATFIGVFYTGINQSDLKYWKHLFTAAVLELICSLMPAILSWQRKQCGSPSTEPIIVERQSRELVTLPADPVAQWIRERLLVRGGEIVKASAIQRDFEAWCIGRGIALPRQWRVDLPTAVKAAGGVYKKARSGVEYHGATLRPTKLVAVN